MDTKKRWIKLSEYGKLIGLKYQAVWNRYKRNEIKNTKIDGGRVFVFIDEDEFFPSSKKTENKVAIYARTSDNNKENLNRQAERLIQYAAMRGYQIVKVVKEIGSGVNDQREKLIKLIEHSDEYSILIVEHKDRLTRFGFNYLDLLFKKINKKIEVVNLSDNNESLIEDMVAIVYSFSARLYGSRKAKRIKEKTIEATNDQ